MSSIEELERKFDVLAAENATLRRRITDLEESVDSHVGIDYGAAQQLSPHPSQQISVAEFGGGIMQLDRYGIRALLDTFGSTVYGLVFQQSLTGLPSELPRIAYFATNTSGVQRLDIDNSNTTTIYAKEQLIADSLSGVSSIELTAKNGSNSGYLLLRTATGGTGDYLDTDLAIGIGIFTADPSWPLYDGLIFYRSDIDRFRVRAKTITRNLTMDGTNTTLTIATGVVTVTTSFHAIDTEAAAASDDLDTISGGQTGQVLYIHAANGARDVVAKDGTGNLKLAGDFTLNNTEDVLALIFDGTNWLEMSRSDNGA